MATDKRFLQWHGQQWRVRRRVPARLQEVVGTSALVHPLHTADLKEANDAKHEHLARFARIIREAERTPTVADPIERDAMRFRVHLKREPKRTQPSEAISGSDVMDLEEAGEVVHDGERDGLYHHAEHLEAEHGASAARRFVDLATYKVTPIEHYLEAFIESKGYTFKSAGDCRRVVTMLHVWLREQGLGGIVESVDRRTAGRFVEKRLTVGRSPRKAQAYKGFLSGYWKWLAATGRADVVEPWTGQPLPRAGTQKPTDAEDEGKRPFTNAEVRKLLDGDPGPVLALLIPLCALSGMRLEEACQLRVVDCADGVFNIRRGKTAAARRRVPIHSDLRGLVAMCSDAKPPEAYLMDGLPEPPPSRSTRSDPASKRFTRYRRRLGIDDRPNGKAKSNVDFHSFRRWFAMTAREARRDGEAMGTDESTLKAVMGHKRDDLTEHLYAGDETMDRKRTLVESVRLPLPAEPIEQDEPYD